MNATTTTEIHDTFEQIRKGLLGLGFSYAAILTPQRVYQSGPILNRVFDGVRYSVRLPRGASGLRKLIFEVEASRHGRRLTSWSRLDVETADPAWVEVVALWMRTQHPLATERMRKEEERAQASKQLSRTVYDAQEKLRALVRDAGHTTKFPTVLNDGTKICGARVEIMVTGSTAEEIAEKMLAIFQQNPGN